MPTYFPLHRKKAHFFDAYKTARSLLNASGSAPTACGGCWPFAAMFGVDMEAKVTDVKGASSSEMRTMED